VRRMHKLWRNDKGFSLLEGLIAIAIFGFGLLAVITMLDVGFNAGTLSKSMTTSTELAAYMMDRIRSDAMSQTDPFSSDRTRLTSFHGMDTSGSAPAVAPASAVFADWQTLIRQSNLQNGKGTVTVVQNPDPNLPLHFTVTVRVGWSLLMNRGVTLQSVMVVPL